MLQFWVYMLRCADGKFYVGHTEDLEMRLWKHQNGTYGGFTSTRRPVELVWFCEFPSRDEALQSELRIKPWSRAKKKALIRSDWVALKRAARGRNARERNALRPSSPPPLRGGYARGERAK